MSERPSATQTQTVTPAPVPSESASVVGTNPRLPPGTRDGLDVRTLAANTARAVPGGSWRLDRLEARPEFSLGTTYVGPRLTANVSGPERYTLRRSVVNARGGGLSLETFENATYVTPEGVYQYDGNVTVTREVDPVDENRPARLAAGYVRRYLDVERANVTRTRDGAVVEGVGTRTVTGTEYAVRAVVTGEGVVVRFTAVYARDGVVRIVSFGLERDSTFTPPAWVGNRTG